MPMCAHTISISKLAVMEPLIKSCFERDGLQAVRNRLRYLAALQSAEKLASGNVL